MSKWIDDQLTKANVQSQWQSMVFNRREYIATLEALKKAEEALSSGSSYYDEEFDREVFTLNKEKVDAALAAIEDLGKE